MPMPPEYLELARLRTKFLAGANTEIVWPKYKQPECFNYKFREWVSPYTKSAHAFGGLVFVLQDWASEAGLKGGVDDEIQKYGRKPMLLTNKRFDRLLETVFGLHVTEVYVTNAFPFIKAGSMSSAIPFKDVVTSVRNFTLAEIKLAQPLFVFSLGALAFLALKDCGVSTIRLPHPAARIGGFSKHEAAWRQAIANINVADVAIHRA